MYVSLCFHSINHLDRYFYFTTLETIPQALIIKISRKLSILNSTENKRRAYDTATYILILTRVQRWIRRYLLKYLTCRITGLSPKISNYQRCRDIQSFLSSWEKKKGNDDESFSLFLRNNESNANEMGIKETKCHEEQDGGNHFSRSTEVGRNHQFDLPRGSGSFIINTSGSTRDSSESVENAFSPAIKSTSRTSTSPNRDWSLDDDSSRSFTRLRVSTIRSI